MLRRRVIPSLSISRSELVKTKFFKNPRYVGDPINAIHIFNEKEVDELMVLDITASRDFQEPNYSLIEQFAGECFMPLAYGGGISSVEQAARIFSLGVEKVCIQTEALRRPSFVTELANEFGSSSVIVSLDLKLTWMKKRKVFNRVLGSSINGDWLQILKTLVTAGAGEVLLNCVDKDGTLSGGDLEAINIASKAIDVPLISVGGISSLNDIKDAFSAGASAVAAGSFFVFYGQQSAVLISYPSQIELEEIFNDIA